MGLTAAQKRAKDLEALKAQLAEVVASDDSATTAEEKQAKIDELNTQIAELEAKVAEDVAKAEAKAAEGAQANASDEQQQNIARKQVDLDKDLERTRPTFARGVQAVLRERIYAKGKN